MRIGLHICGYIDPIMEDLASLPVDWIEIDAPSSLEKLVEINKGEKVIRGNVSAEILSKGTAEQIETEVRRCIEIAAIGNAFILSPGCSMPQDAPLENIETFWKAATKYGYYE